MPLAGIIHAVENFQNLFLQCLHVIEQLKQPLESYQQKLLFKLYSNYPLLIRFRSPGLAPSFIPSLLQATITILQLTIIELGFTYLKDQQVGARLSRIF
jgi:hypothetical protein